MRACYVAGCGVEATHKCVFFGPTWDSKVVFVCGFHADIISGQPGRKVTRLRTEAGAPKGFIAEHHRRKKP